MELEINKNIIKIKNAETFSAHDTIKSGQMFRFEESCCLKVYAGNEYAEAYKANENTTIIECTSSKFFVKYFDLEQNYDIIVSELSKFPELKEALRFGKGIRLLKQNLLEVLVGFIISANNNIPRIKNSMRFVCEELGTQNAHGYGFPTLEALLGADEVFWKSAGLGYRAPYMVSALSEVAENNLLEVLPEMPPDEAKKVLIGLSGVGAKVADCILVFGLGVRNLFPTDTWIEKMYYKFFSQEKRTRVEIADYLSEMFGAKASIAQQYLYYYTRENKIKPD